ncbi:hypothetical protein [Sunxiuqinia sp. sy24]|uniref:hypothetical protein n=1 Tax=Sunxiuqinia sp. sy24 TaxID=3461495 RepID=UPI0040454FE4
MKLNCRIAIFFSLMLVAFGCNNATQQTKVISDSEIDQSWQAGITLPVEVFQKYPLPIQDIKNDKGINVMIDLVHQCKFVTLWGLPERLNRLGYRAIGSQASVHSVLNPEGKSRVRVKWDEENRIYPFAWHPNFSYNVIITHQSDPNAQEYLPEEQEALVDFVNHGGGLIIFGVPPKTEDVADGWSLNQLCERFDAKISAQKDTYRETSYAVIEHSDDWEPSQKGENNLPVAVYRKYGKGHIAIYGHDELLSTKRQEKEENLLKNELLNSTISKVAQGKEPVGGDARYPISGGGGGGIYPELEKQFNDVVLFYAANQKPELIKTVENDIPKAKELVEGWLPSKPTLEPMYLILSSGGGGGWAVNAFKPKENGIISLSGMGILSIFAHELAHTMHGPVNEEGEVAGITPIPNRGEAHAGWFQGKVDAWFEQNLRDYPVKKCNKLFEFDPTGDQLDLVTHYENEKLRKDFGKGKDWTKTWWIWQKLDDRYGPTWYPRWKYVQHNRWKNTPEHRLTWDEMVEDISIAVGEDLFPFLKKAGLSLQKDQMGSITYEGKVWQLKEAPISVSKAGNVKLDKIGNYKNELSVNQ